MGLLNANQNAMAFHFFRGFFRFRQYRTELVVQMRSQILRQIV